MGSMRFDMADATHVESLIKAISSDEEPIGDLRARLMKLCKPSAGSLPVSIQVRRSRDQRAQEASLRDQVRRAVDRFEREGNRRLVIVYVRENISGALLNRKGLFDDVIADAKDGLYVEFWTLDTSRFGRMGHTEKGFIRHQLAEAGVKRRYFTIDATGMEVELLEAVYDMLDALEIRQKAERSVERTNARHDERGIRSGKTPYALALQVTDEAGNVRIIPRRAHYQRSTHDQDKFVLGDPAEVAVYKKIIMWMLDGDEQGKVLGGLGVARRLNAEGVPAPEGGKWGRASVLAIAKNFVYVGARAYFRNVTGIFKTRGPDGRPIDVMRPGAAKHRSKKPRDQWRVQWNKHEPLITLERWEALQAELARRAGLTGAKKANQHSLRSDRLTPLARCENCKGTMQASTRVAGGHWLQCKSYHEQGICSNNNVSDTLIASIIWKTLGDGVRKLLATTNLDEKTRGSLKKILAERLREADRRGEPSVADAKREIREIDTKVDELSENLSKESLKLLDKKLKELAARKTYLEGVVSAAARPKAKAENLDARIEKAMERLALLNEPLAKVAPSQTAKRLLEKSTRDVFLKFSVRQAGKYRRSRIERLRFKTIAPGDLLASSLLHSTEADTSPRSRPASGSRGSRSRPRLRRP
jgi:hypothetical protein